MGEVSCCHCGDILFPTRGRSNLGTADRRFVSTPEKRPGKERRCATIRITGPTRNDVSRTGAGQILITGRNIDGNVLNRRDAIGNFRRCGMQGAVAGI